MSDLFDSAQSILSARVLWEEKQRRYFVMRHDGLARKDKGVGDDWKSDGHSSTIDRAIRKNKPFWLGQLTAGDRLCNFTALVQQADTMSDAAANYYDFYTYQNTNLIDEINVAVDSMLLKGRGIIKSTVDPLKGYKIIDESIDPMYLLMPQAANDFEDADEWIHIRLFTVQSYKRLDARWDSSAETIQKIRGTKDFRSLGIYDQAVRLREGITHVSNPDYILVFEHWRKTSGGHTINYYSPHDPTLQLRKPHGNPYKNNGEESIPFNSFQMEIKDKGWYSPRGLGELLDVQEQLETFIENKWADAMTIANTRIYTGDKELANTANLRLEDGQYIAGGIQTVQFSTPSIPYTEMLYYSRGRSEEISQAPDAGAAREGSKTGGKPITAAENNRLGQLEQVGANYNADIFRRRLAKIHKHRWCLMCQFKQKEFSYYSAGELNKLPEEALHEAYQVTPDGSAEGWNRQARIQKEIYGMQTFASLPNSNPDYWAKRAMGAFDSRAALQGFQATGQKQANEYAAQVININAMLAPSHGRPSFPAPVNPQEDHATRIKADLDWLHACMMTGVPPDPQAIQRVQQDMAQRMELLKKQNPAAAKQVMQMIQQLEQSAQPQPPNVEQMPQAPQQQIQ